MVGRGGGDRTKRRSGVLVCLEPLPPKQVRQLQKEFCSLQPEILSNNC